MSAPQKALSWFLLGALVFLYLHLFIPPFVPLWIGGDQTVYLVNASRMLHGEVLYRDFFQFTTPGTELVYLSLFKLFGAREWVSNLTLILLGLTLIMLVVKISRKVLNGWTAYLPALLVVTIPYRNMLNGTHHWFSATAIMGALAVATGKLTRVRVIVAGILCGVATFLTQAHGIAATVGFLVFLFLGRERCERASSRLKDVSGFLAGFFASVLAANVYFVSRAGPTKFWYSTVIFGLKYYPADREANSWRSYLAGWPHVPPWHHLPIFASWLLIYSLLPLVYVIFIARYSRQLDTLRPGPRDALMLLSIVGLVLVLGVAPAPNFFRLFPVSPPALIVFVWLISQVRRHHRLLLGFLCAFGLFLALTEPWSNQRGWHGFLDFPAGQTAFLSREQYDKYGWMLHHTQPSEWFFDASRLPGLYFPLDLRNPAKVSLLTTTDYTRPEQVEDLLVALERRQVRLINWSANLDHPEDPAGTGDHLGPLRSYVRSHYRVIKTFADGDQVWERSDKRVPAPARAECLDRTPEILSRK